MAARYGDGRRSRGLLVVVVVVISVFLAVIGWITWRMATPGVQSTLLRFTVVSDARVDITFDVRRDTTSTTVCVLRAQSERHADVGYATVTITPGRDYVQTTYPLATSALATTADVLGCSSTGDPRVDAPAFLPGTVNPSQVATIDGS
jgi:hypothetical protein